MANDIKISLITKDTPTVNLQIQEDAKNIAIENNNAPLLKFIATGEKGDTGAQGDAVQDYSITNEKLGENSVSSYNIQENAVNSFELNNNAVHESNINNGAVSTNKLSNGAVTTIKLQNNSVTADKIAPGAISQELLELNSVDSSRMASSAVTTEKVQDSAITAAKIADNTVTGTEIEDNVSLVGTVSVTYLKIDGASPGYIFGPNDDDFYVQSEQDLIFRIDSDESLVSNNSQFKFLSGDNTELATLSETGVFTLNGDITLTGSMVVSGSVDGRDVSVDGVKLDSIESNATADQTDAEIRAAVENATDSNVFTDADHTKLDGIEVGATADQTVEEIQDIAGPLVATGGTKTGIAITYDDDNGNMDFVVDHDAATNFVAEEHYRWDNDIQSTATINHANLSSDSANNGEVLAVVDGDAVWGHPEKVHLEVRNDEGATIPAGAPLYSKGEIGGSNRILVGVCDANDSAKMPCIGIAETEMNTSSTQNGFAIISGIYNTNISGFTSLDVGDNLYIQDDGSLSQAKPTGEGSLIQNVGIVLKTNGTICQGMLVSAIGRTNDVPNLDQNALFIGNASNQAVATDAPMVGVITAADAGAARTALGVDATGTDNSTNVTITGEDYLSLSGQEITANNIDLTDNVTGTLPVANGGTGATSLTANSILTGSGTNAITAQSRLTYGSEILSIGEPDSGLSTITRNNGAGTNGGGLIIQSGRASVGTNLTGGDLTLRGGPGTGTGASGNIVFEAGVPASSGTGAQNVQEIATLDGTGNLSIDGDLTVKGNDIKDDDGTTCITFDSSGNTTIANTLNASVTGNVTGNASTADALTTGNKDIEGTLNIKTTSPGANPFISLSQTTTRRAFIQLADNNLGYDNHLRIASEYGPTSIAAASTPGADTDTAYFLVEPGGTFKFGAQDSDATLTTDGSMTFKIDADNDETSQSFLWKDDSDDTIAELDENGEFTVYGGALGDPKITLHQTGQNVTYGPPLLDFYREDTLVDNADIGHINFIAKDSGDNDQVYAKVIGGSEESGSGTEGGKIQLQIATHDGELITGLKIEDGNAEDEIDVTIGNGSASSIYIPGALSVMASSFFSVAPLFSSGLDIGSADTTLTRTGPGEVAIEGSNIVKESHPGFQKHVVNCGWYGNSASRQYLPFGYGGTFESTSPNGYLEYGAFVAPCNGEVESVIVRSEIACGNSTVGIHIAQNGTEVPSYNPGTGVSDTVNMAADDTSYKFESFDGQYANDLNTFNAGDVIFVSFDPTVASQDSVATMILNLDWTNSL